MKKGLHKFYHLMGKPRRISRARLVNVQKHRMIHNITKTSGRCRHFKSPKLTQKTHPQKIDHSNHEPRFSPGFRLVSPSLNTSVCTVTGAPETPGAWRRQPGGHVVPPAQPEGAHSVPAPPGTAQPSAHRSGGVVSGWEAAWKGWHLKDRMTLLIRAGY